MIHRVEGVPEGLEPGAYEVRFVRLNGDVIIYEYVEPQRTNDE